MKNLINYNEQSYIAKVHGAASGGYTMKYLFWRGRSLYCRYPIEGFLPAYPLEIYRRSDSKTEIDRCVKLGETKLNALRAEQSLKGTLFEKLKQVDKAPQKPIEYNPKYWRLVARYWYHSLRFKKCAKDDRYHLIHSLKKFGARFAKDIAREAVELWRQEMIQSGCSVNSVNNRYAYLKRVYSWSNSESKPINRINYDPTIGLEKLPGANVRTFVLTEDKFERNYLLLQNGRKWPGEKPNKHCTEWQVTADPRFALFYLALWETGRRPDEVSNYTWSMVNELEIEGKPVRLFFVPPGIAKTDKPDNVLISDRLWSGIQQLAYRQGFVFRNSTGDRWQHWDRHQAKLEKVFGQDCGWIRDTRRGFVTHKTEVLGCDPKHVRMQSGHRTNSVFERYRIGDIRRQISVVANQTQKHANFVQFSKQG